MKNRKVIKLIEFFILSIFLFVMTFSLSSCEENEWIPSVQGSTAMEIEYEEMSEAYTVEKFNNFKIFSKSSWADYYFCSQVPAKEERYSKEYFKNSDLIIIKFNMPEKGINYSVIDVSIVENLCTVLLLPIKRVAKITEQMSTYCCFVETSIDVTDLTVELKFEEPVLHESQSLPYITANIDFYIFENQTEPMVFVIDSKNGISQFVEYDEILNKENYVYVHLNSYNEDVFQTYSLMLVRVLSSVFEDLAIYLDGDKLNIVGTYSNHYLFDKETQFHKLVALFVPKDTNIKEISRTIYYEYEDNLEVKRTFNTFSQNVQSDIAENVKKYSFVQDHD